MHNIKYLLGKSRGRILAINLMSPILSDVCFDVGVGLVGFVLSIAATFATLKTLGVGRSGFISVFVGMIVFVYMARAGRRWVPAVIGIIVIFFSLIVSALYFDIYFDGITYHQDAIISLTDSFSLFNQHLGGRYAYLVENYPKLSWYYGAALTEFTGKLHYAKSINVILVSAVFFVSISALSSISYRLIFAAMLAMNPIAISQVFSHYVDGLLGEFLALSFLGLYLSVVRGEQRNAVILVFLGAIGASCLKFTGLVFSAVIISLFMLWNIRRFKLPGLLSRFSLSGIGVDNSILRREEWLKIWLLIPVAVVLLWNPYATHLLAGHHVFYPVMGADKIQALIAGQTRPEFFQLNSFSKLLISLFSQSVDHGPWAPTPFPPSKIPFVIYPEELAAFASIDIRAAGWGPLFGGVFLVCMIALIAGANVKSTWRYFLFVLAVVSAVNPESWWARFNPQLYLFVVFALLAIQECSERKSIITNLMMLALAFNAVLVFSPMHNYVSVSNTNIERNLRSAFKGSRDGYIYWDMDRFHLDVVLERLGIPRRSARDVQFLDSDCDIVMGEKVCVLR